MLRIYDAAGREVALLLDKMLSPGAHSVTWDAAGFPTGTYFYSLIMDERVDSGRMLLVK